MKSKRRSGILAHPTSFPSPYGIGDLGKGAYNFIDFLEKSGQKLWQVLPLNPTSYGDSPYQSFSSFAGNPLLISPDLLVKEQYLTQEDIASPPDFGDPKTVDYGLVISIKKEMLLKAYTQFKVDGNEEQINAFAVFCKAKKVWLNDYALFIAIKEYLIVKRKQNMNSKEYKQFIKTHRKHIPKQIINDYYFGAEWHTWPEDIAKREKKAIDAYKTLLEDEIKYYKFLQYEFHRQWRLLKNYANEKDIEIIGDLPIFVSSDSVEMWANPELFDVDENGYPSTVAGVPPDYFSEIGQLWGNPLYDYEYQAKDGYRWWVHRIKNILENVDIIRIDHFRGFDSYWEIKYGQSTAIRGKWKKGPGIQFFIALQEKLEDIPIIAEDLGEITEDVRTLRKALGYPGMRVLQFAFNDTAENAYLPHNIEDSNCVIYTGTHDNDTTLGWYQKANDKTTDFFRRYLNISGENPVWDMIRLAYSSCADTVIIPLQDLMNLDSSHRMNTPGTTNGNWAFRYTEDMLNECIEQNLTYLNKLFNR